MLLEQFLRPHRVFIGVGVLVALGIGYSVYSRAADPPQSDAASRSQVNTELSDVGRAVGRLNQSYAIPPVISGQAFTGGSYFIDTQDGGDGGIALNQAPRDDASASDAQAGGKATRIKLPPPLVIGDLCRQGCQLPCWLQGDIGWLYGELPGPVCVDIPRPVGLRLFVSRSSSVSTAASSPARRAAAGAASGRIGRVGRTATTGPRSRSAHAERHPSADSRPWGSDPRTAFRTGDAFGLEAGRAVERADASGGVAAVARGGRAVARSTEPPATG